MVDDWKPAPFDIEHIWRNPGLLHEQLLQPGFSLPEIAGLRRSSLTGIGDNLSFSSGQHGYTFDISDNCKNNVVIISENSKCQGRIFIRGSNNVAILCGGAPGSSPVNVHFHSSNSVFYFGPHGTSNTATFEMQSDGTSILVGEDCMFSAFIVVTTSDDHAIFDIETGEHLNPASDVIIEPHVWVGMHAMILKGVRVGFGSIIGARSLVTRSVPEKTAVAGAPARPIRSGVSWTRDHRIHPNVRTWFDSVEKRLSKKE